MLSKKDKLLLSRYRSSQSNFNVLYYYTDPKELKNLNNRTANPSTKNSLATTTTSLQSSRSPINSNTDTSVFSSNLPTTTVDSELCNTSSFASKNSTNAVKSGNKPRTDIIIGNGSRQPTIKKTGLTEFLYFF